MLVTTYYHPRSLPYPDEIDEIEGPWPQDELPMAIGEGGDRDDLMGGSQAGLYSSDEGEEHNLVWWHGSESDLFEEEEWNREESDHLEFNDTPEGTLGALKGPHTTLTVHTVTPPSAKRRRPEKAVLSGMASSSKTPAKSKRIGVSRRIQGRLQNMLSLPFDVLFLVSPY
jgi:hypothetical protein